MKVKYVQFEWFVIPLFGTISLEEYHCLDGLYQYILGQLITNQDNSWLFGFPLATVDTTAALLTFQRWAKLLKAKLRDKFPFQFFKSSKNFPFPLKFWQNYLIDWAEKRASWWTAAKKVNLISVLIAITNSGNLFQNTLQPCSPTRYVRVSFAFQEGTAWT